MLEKDGWFVARTNGARHDDWIGVSREVAPMDLESSAKFWMLHMKETRQAVAEVGVEVTSIEVAA